MIRSCREVDLSGILAIYNHAVEATDAVWNDTIVDLENRLGWWRGRVDSGFPVLVALGMETEKGQVLGFASYGPFRAFDGYRLTVEHSIYVAETARRRGIARALLAALESEARRTGMHVMVGGITGDNHASLRLHADCGFSETARMPELGHKFGRWLDLVFMQKLLT